MISATSSQGAQIQYGHYDDGMLARRHSNQSGQPSEIYLYDGIHVIAKYDGSGNLLQEYLYGPGIDEILSRSDVTHGTRYYHQDALQSVVAITDGYRNIVARYEYDVYGAVRNKTGTVRNEILYTGRWLDAETGLYYYRARWYDAQGEDSSAGIRLGYGVG